MPDKKLEEIINRILQVLKPDKIILFGSRAQAVNNKESDYDLLVVKSGIEQRRQTAMRIHQNLIGVNVSVDVIVETPERLEQFKNSTGYIYKTILEEGVVVYG